MNANPTLDELHADDIERGAIHINDQRWEGMYCVLVPDPDVSQRWLTIKTFKSKVRAVAFGEGYCARRDEQKGKTTRVFIAGPESGAGSLGKLRVFSNHREAARYAGRVEGWWLGRDVLDDSDPSNTEPAR
jgi:hypothetical protein